MCGIAGYKNVKNHSSPINEHLLINMQRTLHHRGPDDSGIYISHPHQLGLAHARLSIIDLSDAGRQPMSNATQKITVCFNGEIYNYQELRKELEARGHRYQTHTDTETLIHAYEEWGIRFLDKLEGMFAIALFDATKDELYLIRDRMGIKPLYFSDQAGYVSFASEIKALWQLPWIRKEASDIAYYHYLTFMTPPAPYTIYKNIYKLPAGFYAKLTHNKLSFHEWYTPLTTISAQEQKQFHDEHYCIETIRTLLKNSTKKRMISDVPFGAFLSGGIDSSLNVALMAAHIKKVKTFTVSFADGPESNELQWARLVAKTFDTDHHEITLSEQDAINVYNKMIYHNDDPIADCVCIPFYYVSKLARESGVKVVQVGEGSDELFFGYNIYAQYKKIHDYYWRFMQYGTPGLKKLLYRFGNTMFSKKPNIVDTLYKHAYNKHLFWGGAIGFTDTQKHHILKPGNTSIHDPIVARIYPGMQQGYDSNNIVDYHLQALKKRDPHASFMKQMAYLELKQRLPELLLMRADKMSMATSIEARVPFLDHKLVEFALHIPDHIKFKNRTTKYILKKACEGIIPHEIIYRKKMGFAAPIVRWEQSNSPLFAKHHVTLPANKNRYNVALQKWILQNYNGLF